MKNYLVIFTLNQSEQVIATFHNVEQMDVLTRLSFENTLSQSTAWDTTSPMEQGKVYYLEGDQESDIESAMRTLGFRRCDRCGAWVTPQDIRDGLSTWNRATETRLCATCIAREEQEEARNPKISLAGYHSTSSNVRVINGEGETFDLNNVKGLGIEMEANASSRASMVRNNQIKCTDAFYRMAKPGSRNRIFRCEQDCTVAAEIISNVFTKKSLYDFDWNILTEQLRLMGNDENIANVGFHVHLSKTWLGDTQKEQALNFLKLQYVLKAYETDWLKISGRRPSEMSWCSFYSMQSIENFKSCLESGRYSGYEWSVYPSSHSYALISSGSTIELRIGKSTNDPEKIKHYLRLVLGIVENLKSVRFEKIYCMSKIFKLVPSETMNYWRKNGAFLNTVAVDNRGITVTQQAA